MTKFFVTAKMLHDAEVNNLYFIEELLSEFPAGAYWADILDWLAVRNDVLQCWTWLMDYEWASPVRSYYDAYRLIVKVADQEFADSVNWTRDICGELLEMCRLERHQKLEAMWRKYPSDADITHEERLHAREIANEITEQYGKLTSWLVAQQKSIETPAKQRHDAMLHSNLHRLAQELRANTREQAGEE